MMLILAVLALSMMTRAKGDAMVGTNLGGWLVLEPWITPSLFYRFLGKSQNEGVGVDSYTLCQALGPKLGNHVMRSHWDSWLTEDYVKALADRNVEIVRLPLGDWTLKPYGPYIGCMDGAADKIDWLLDTAQKYNIKVLLDVHAVIDSQNGFDNSGRSWNFKWVNETHFEHWSILNSTWMGHFDGDSQQYTSINKDNMQWSVDVVKGLMERWGKHPAVYALEPVNEPWWLSDLPTLKQFYRTCRAAIQVVNPNVKFVFHDSFRTSADTWNDLFEDDDMDNVIMDTHKYLAWAGRMDDIGQYCDAYGATFADPEVANIKYPVWVGEWSLATDVCAMWLGGFNDANTDAQFECQRVTCPASYMPAPYATDFDRSAALLGPIGESDASTISYGQCLTDSSFFSAQDVKTLGDCSSYILNQAVAGQFLWNFRTELEPRWSYIEAYDQGWLNNYSSECRYQYVAHEKDSTPLKNTHRGGHNPTSKTQ